MNSSVSQYKDQLDETMKGHLELEKTQTATAQNMHNVVANLKAVQQSQRDFKSDVEGHYERLTADSSKNLTNMADLQTRVQTLETAPPPVAPQASPDTERVIALNEEMQNLKRRLNEHGVQVLVGTNNRLDTHENRQDTHESRMDTQDSRLDTHEETITSLRNTCDTQKELIKKLESKSDALVEQAIAKMLAGNDRRFNAMQADNDRKLNSAQADNDWKLSEMQKALDNKANDDRVDETSSALNQMADLVDTKASDFDLQNKIGTLAGRLTTISDDVVAHKTDANTRLNTVKQEQKETGSKLTIIESGIQTLENKSRNDFTQPCDDMEARVEKAVAKQLGIVLSRVDKLEVAPQFSSHELKALHSIRGRRR
jgi:hypothetical protein